MRPPKRAIRMRTLLLGCGLLGAASPATARTQQPVDLVDPFMGTSGDRGQLSPAAAAPFGMVQLAPDTAPANHIGYDRDAPVLLGFSQTRAQGVGCGGGGGDLLASVAYADEPGPSAIAKGSQQAGASWYKVRYGASGIAATLAAGQSVSISRFALPRTGQLRIMLNPTHSYAKHVGQSWSSTVPGDLRLGIDNRTVCGQGIYHLHVAATLTLNGRPLKAQPSPDVAGVLALTIPVRGGDALELRVALSTVDDASAHDVLERELGTADIATLMARTRRDWDAILARVAVDDAEDKRRLFYTCLFRELQMPARLDDAQGRFRTPDGALHQAPAGHHRYGGWSLWDNYRTQMPLVALVAPEVARDMAASLVDLFTSRKAQWAGDAEPFLSVRTEHAGIALLDLARKGLAPADLANALPPMAREADELPSATPDQRLELAYDEWAIAQLAHDLGQNALAERFTQRWQAYRPLWQKVFEPLGSDADTVKARGLYQGTLWQYRWAPVFDLPWLRDTALGRERFAQQLGTFFDRKLFNMTNEPDIQAPFLFALAGQPERADALVAALRDGPYEHWYDNQAKLAKPFIQNSFSLSPGFADGMDDDGGAMSAWYVWASLGLYPMVPGEPWYVATLPGVRRASLSMEGHTFTILRHGTGERAARLTLDGRALPDRRIDHAALVHGGTLSFDTAR